MPVATASDLYGLPLDQFIPERALLAKTLRAGGDRDEAARVGALRKPSAAAWTVNQLVRTQRRAFEELLEAGDDLAGTQSELLRGRGDAKALRAAAERERDAVRTLTETARGLLGSSGQEPTAATLDRVADTLHAAAVDEDARAQVKDGCLVRELQHVGLGAGDLGAAAEAERAKADETKARLTAARRAEKQARRGAETTARAAEIAQRRRDGIAEQLAQADAALAEASERAEQAALAHSETLRALERAE